METEKIEIRCSVDKATRDALIALADKNSAPNKFAEFAGELLAKSIKK